MSHLHLCYLDLVDERGQAGGVEYFPDVDSEPADNEIAAAILARAAAIFQRGRQLQLMRSVGPSLPSVPCRTRVCSRSPLRHTREMQRRIRGLPRWGFRGATTHGSDATAVDECRDWLAKGRP